ncbi:MAG: hypothetical protein V4614_12660 [Pseudomonadota bacterium]
MRLISRFLAIPLLCMLMLACSKPVSREAFVGKWKSSQLTTPIYLHANGEWEVKKDEDGGVLQFGVWQYTDDRIVWSVKVNSEIIHDPNKVLSVSPKEFRLAEKGGTTVFQRIE